MITGTYEPYPLRLRETSMLLCCLTPWSLDHSWQQRQFCGVPPPPTSSNGTARSALDGALDTIALACGGRKSTLELCMSETFGGLLAGRPLLRTGFRRPTPCSDRYSKRSICPGAIKLKSRRSTDPQWTSRDALVIVQVSVPYNS